MAADLSKECYNIFGFQPCCVKGVILQESKLWWKARVQFDPIQKLWKAWFETNSAESEEIGFSEVGFLIPV